MQVTRLQLTATVYVSNKLHLGFSSLKTFIDNLPVKSRLSFFYENQSGKRPSYIMHISPQTLPQSLRGKVNSSFHYFFNGPAKKILRNFFHVFCELDVILRQKAFYYFSFAFCHFHVLNLQKDFHRLNSMKTVQNICYSAD